MWIDLQNLYLMEGDIQHVAKNWPICRPNWKGLRSFFEPFPKTSILVELPYIPDHYSGRTMETLANAQHNNNNGVKGPIAHLDRYFGVEWEVEFNSRKLTAGLTLRQLLDRLDGM